jgi:hypothetical protein
MGTSYISYASVGSGGYAVDFFGNLPPPPSPTTNYTFLATLKGGVDPTGVLNIVFSPTTNIAGVNGNYGPEDLPFGTSFGYTQTYSWNITALDPNAGIEFAVYTGLIYGTGTDPTGLTAFNFRVLKGDPNEY